MSVDYVSIKDLMIEIEALRGLLAVKNSDTEMLAETEAPHQPLKELKENAKTAVEIERSRSDTLIAKLKAEIVALKSAQSQFAGQLDAKTNGTYTSQNATGDAEVELERLRTQMDQVHTQLHQEKSIVRTLEDELRLIKSRDNSPEVQRLRTQLLEKDKRSSEQTKEVSQFKFRFENSVKDVEQLRKRQREDEIKHREEIKALKMENMRIKKHITEGRSGGGTDQF